MKQTSIIRFIWAVLFILNNERQDTREAIRAGLNLKPSAKGRK